MKSRSFGLPLFVLLVAVGLRADAAEKITLHINRQTISAWRMSNLESTRKEAAAKHEPIAWIASSSVVLDGRGTISLHNARGATLHAFYSLRDRAVLVFMDAYQENHKVLPLVDKALHTPNPHYTPPTVVFLNSEATKVLAKVEYERDFVKRAQALAKALDEIKGKY